MVRRERIPTWLIAGIVAVVWAQPGPHAWAPRAAAAPAAVAPLVPVTPTPRLVRQPGGLLTGVGTVSGTHLTIPYGAKPHRGRHGGDPRARQSTAPDAAGNTDPVPPPFEAATSDGSAPDPFTIFRQSTVIAGSTLVGLTAEPTVANDRNVVLVTGNDFARVSSDTGLDGFRSQLDPKAFDALSGADGAAPGDKYTSDQSVIAIDRGASSLLVWVLLNSDASASDGDAKGVNSIRVVVFRNADHLVDNLAAPVTPDVCRFAFTTATLGRPGRFIDFPRPWATNKYLYITASIFKLKNSGEPKGTGAEGAILRLPIDDLDDPQCRTGFRLWHDDRAQVLSGVQGAGSTMYIARHRETLGGDTLRIYSVSDSSTKLNQYNRNITNFADDGKQDCPIGSASDPCRFDERIVTGFRSGGTVGWMWTARQSGKDYPYPYVKVATFSTFDLSLRKEASIWNPDFAWNFPAAAVNERGDVGVVLYKMGGTANPEARAFIVPAATVATAWPPPRTHQIVASTHPPVASFGGSIDSQWGDYTSVARFGECPNTFLGAVYSLQGGGFSTNAEVRTVWFGDPADACADLDVGELTVPNLVTPGQSITVNETSRNIGSGTSRQSRTAYYLSDDDTVDADDIRIDETHFVPELPGGGSDAKSTQVFVSPFLWEGGTSLYVIACADDRELADEITDTNNCRTSRPLQVLFGGGLPRERLPFDASVLAVTRSGPARLRAGARVTASIGLRGTGRRAAASLTRRGVLVTLSPRPGGDPGEVKLLRSTIVEGRRRGGARPQRTFTLSGVIPPRLAAGKWHLRVCVTRPRRTRDANTRNDCRVAGRTLTITRANR